ncbi:hypothetical protein PsorP6_013472 [Peronosclerospora sorghi]|uniref:Uncharacterized protein n=1 Tax=Peronosclerospora sorghi TaxID=230839 RepID=A0ACC0VJG7_9STRA|nr:hypothetical protein PsorP6_013472 [Peronosclerospora sorghi]
MDDDKFSSRCDESQTADDPLLVTPSASIATGNETDEAEALPRFSLLGAKIAFEPAQVGPRASEEQEEGNGAKTEDDAFSTPSFNILGAVSSFSGTESTIAKESKCIHENSYQKDTKDAELHLKIEANSLKALKKQHKRQLDDVASLSMTPQRNESPQWIIYVSSTFASYCPFFDVSIDETFSMRKICTLLSVRVAVYFPPDQELQDLSRASSTQNFTTSRRLETLLAMHKRLVIAIVHSGNELPGIRQLQQLQNVTVIIQPTIDSCVNSCMKWPTRNGHKGMRSLLHVPEGSDTSAGDLDASFTSRLQFFRTLYPLSLDSALSLSFRFKNFTAKQVPVLRLNVMHWRRMLPWIRVDSPRRSNTPDEKGASTLSCIFWSMELLHEQRL